MELRWVVRNETTDDPVKVLQYRTEYDTYDYSSQHEGAYPQIKKWSEWKDIPTVDLTGQ